MPSHRNKLVVISAEQCTGRISSFNRRSIIKTQIFYIVFKSDHSSNGFEILAFQAKFMFEEKSNYVMNQCFPLEAFKKTIFFVVFGKLPPSYLSRILEIG